MVEVKIGYWTDGPNWILIWSGNRNEMQYCSRKQNHNASRVKRSMHFASLMLTLIKIIYLSTTRSMVLYHLSEMMRHFYAGIKQSPTVGSHDWESPCAWRKIHRNCMVGGTLECWKSRYRYFCMKMNQCRPCSYLYHPSRVGTASGHCCLLPGEGESSSTIYLQIIST